MDIGAGVVTVRHGKGDKERVAAILDSTDGARLTLERLRASQLEQFRYLFASTTRGRGTKWLANVPTSDEVVALVVEKTADAAGLWQTGVARFASNADFGWPGIWQSRARSAGTGGPCQCG